MSKASPDFREFLHTIRERNRQFYGDPRGFGALKDLQQTFPNPWLYVAELLQNAVDENATRIMVLPHDDTSLVFEHDGSPFSSANVESLCMRGVSTKGAATVGFMGIGFKSVFRSFERAEISSGPWRFALTVANRKGQRFGDNQRDWIGAVLPEWDENVAPPADGMNCRFRLCRRLTDLPPITTDLERLLGDDEALLALLAWQGVKELTWGSRKWLLNTRDFPFSDGTGNRVELTITNAETTLQNRWVLLSKKYQPTDAAIARFLEHRQLTPSTEDQPRVYEEASRSRQVAVFCGIDEVGCPQPVDRGSAFALLPTGVTFPLGLHVQADWLLVVSRRDLMQIEGNQWHEEILSQIPDLLKRFLAWLVEMRWPANSDWTSGYDVLPGEFSRERETDAWFQSDTFRDALAEDLSDLPFLPVPTKGGKRISFIPPASARELPRAIAHLFEDDQRSHRLLFGKRVFSSALLGERALRCLHDLELLGELSAKDLENLWSDGTVGRWFEQTEENRRDQALAELLEAVATLDVDPEWNTAKLPCLPSEKGGWICRDEATRFPSDWAVLAQEDAIRHAFERLMGDRSKIVRWSFDRYIQQPRSPGTSYLARIVPYRLEDLAEKWWKSLPNEPNDSQVKLALRFTGWVRVKQFQRKELIRKLLSRTDNERPRLLPTSEVLIADPYAESCRRRWFPAVPMVSSEYVGLDENASPGDWRSFFESLNPTPKGRFALRLTAGSYSRAELRALLGETYEPPSRRSTYRSVTWRGLSLTSNEYKVLDADLPTVMEQLFADSHSITRDESRAMTTWMSESPAMLREYSSCRLAYIPYGWSSETETTLTRDASWKRTFLEKPWVFASSGDGPFCPQDILREFDPARSDAPVADLPSALINVLQNTGIEFGSRLPDAPAIIRLRAQGATASITELLRLMQNAIDEASSEKDKEKLLRDVLGQTNIFPLPLGRESLDRLSRVTLHRVIRSERGRSNLSSWVTPLESFPAESPERQLFDLVNSLFPFPTDTTGGQALAFLAWVWRTKPDADRARTFLPRAYQYVLEDIDQDLQSQIEDLRTAIVVFTQNTRQWLLASDENVFLNDLSEGALPGSIDVSLATPGHLGESRDDQIAVAELLGLRLLSSRFTIETFPSDSYSVPDLWQQAFTKVQQELLRRVTTVNAGDDTQEDVAHRPLFSLTRCDEIYTVVLDNDVEIQRYPRVASLYEGVIYVTGSPADFAEPVCQILFNEWGLRFRRDLVDLIPKVAIQLSRVDDEQIWVRPIDSENRSGPEPGPESPDETPSESFDAGQNDQGETNQIKKTDSTSGGPQGTERSDKPGLDAQKEEQKRSLHNSTLEHTAGRGHTASDRESIIQTLVHRRNEIEKQLREATSVGVVPTDPEASETPSKREFQSDDRFREAVMNYERKRGRFPRPKSDTQAGHDIDSFDSEEGNPDRKLARRIEVKGKGVPWKASEIVEQSDRQYLDASKCFVESGTALTSDFDYWLYVVEVDTAGKLNVIPIRNPAKRAAHYEFRAGTWRHIAEVESEFDPD